MVRSVPVLLALAACNAPDEAATPVDPDFGPPNSWPHATLSQVPAGLAGTGYREGDTVTDATLVDQFGDEVQLYQFYGRAIVLDVFAEWCGPCQDHAPEGEAMYQDLRDRGVIVVAVMQETADDSPVDAGTAARWADEFGLTHPVLADPERVFDRFQQIGGGFPTYPVIGPDMTVILQDLWPPDQGRLEALLEDIGFFTPTE